MLTFKRYYHMINKEIPLLCLEKLLPIPDKDLFIPPSTVEFFLLSFWCWKQCWAMRAALTASRNDSSKSFWLTRLSRRRSENKKFTELFSFKRLSEEFSIIYTRLQYEQKIDIGFLHTKMIENRVQLYFFTRWTLT